MVKPLALLLAVGCGGAQAAAPAAEAPPAEAPAVDTEAYARLSDFFARKRPHVTQCYDNAFVDVEPAKRASGYVTVTLDVLPSGRAENVRVSDQTLGSESVASCVVGLVSGWALPQPAERTAFTFSYQFRPL
jgi:hypothetical protein